LPSRIFWWEAQYLAIHIPEEKLAEIRSTANISDIISERVILKKAGKDLVGLCPFHSEKTPSFTVSNVKQIYHCFGCGAGGDVFSFLMKQDGINFYEAVQNIARRYGIELPSENLSPTQKKIATQRQQLLDLNKQIISFFSSQLSDDSIGKNARSYLERRGFNQEIIDRFGLGFVPDSWDNLICFFRKIKVSQSLAGNTGLIIPKKNGGFYDRFRNRVIFPIFDVSSQIIGFGGRVLDDSKPKYLNSPETMLYNKSRSLYGVQAARKQARETGIVYIVEGYFDCLALQQHQITNTVATQGTSLTAEHVRLLRRGFAQKAFLVFDSDEAGLKAAHRSISLFMNEAMDASVIVLPKGYDPDSYIFEFGKDAFKKEAEKALGMVEFLIESSIKANGLSMEGKVRVISDLQQPLSEIRDNVAKSIYVKYLAERLNVDEKAIFEKIRSVDKKSSFSKEHQISIGNEYGSTHAQGDFSVSPDLIRFEKQIVTMMMKVSGILPEIRKRRVLDYFVDKNLVYIAQLILEKPVESDEGLAKLMNRIESPELKNLAASFMINNDTWDLENCNKLLTQFIKSRERSQDNLLKQIKSAEESKDDELLFKLLKQKQEQLINR